MNYKIKGAMKKSKIPFIVSIILWLLLTIVFVVPLSFSIFAATQKGGFDTNKLFQAFGICVTKPFETLGYIFSHGAVGTFFTTEIIFTALYSIFFFIGFVRARPKHEYSDIEHGSSDWSRSGEQYQILSKNKGIILAENNYLPVDKRGNVNVLVVGRFRFW